MGYNDLNFPNKNEYQHWVKQLLQTESAAIDLLKNRNATIRLIQSDLAHRVQLKV